MVTSLEFMTARVKRPFFIDKWHIFSFFKQTEIRPLRFPHGNYKRRLDGAKNIDGNDVLRKNVAAIR